MPAMAPKYTPKYYTPRKTHSSREESFIDLKWIHPATQTKLAFKAAIGNVARLLPRCVLFVIALLTSNLFAD